MTERKVLNVGFAPEFYCSRNTFHLIMIHQKFPGLSVGAKVANLI